jgi:hypothetical protein
MHIVIDQAIFHQNFRFSSQGPDPKAVNELIKIEGVLNAIIRDLEKAYVS